MLLVRVVRGNYIHMNYIVWQLSHGRADRCLYGKFYVTKHTLYGGSYCLRICSDARLINILFHTLFQVRQSLLVVVLWRLVTIITCFELWVGLLRRHARHLRPRVTVEWVLRGSALPAAILLSFLILSVVIGVLPSSFIINLHELITLNRAYILLEQILGYCCAIDHGGMRSAYHCLWHIGDGIWPFHYLKVSRHSSCWRTNGCLMFCLRDAHLHLVIWLFCRCN